MANLSRESTWYDLSLLPKYNRALWIVGPTGTGKSTLAETIQRVGSPFYGVEVLECGSFARISAARAGVVRTVEAITAHAIGRLAENHFVFANDICDELEGNGGDERVVVVGARNPTDFVLNFEPLYDAAVFLSGEGATAFERTGIEAIRAYLRFLLAVDLLDAEQVVDLPRLPLRRPPLHPPEESPMTTTDNRNQVDDAKKPHSFTIRTKHIEKAQCGDPAQCVIAQALNDSMGAFFDGVEVGATITKVFYPGRIVRFATPAKLRKALITFDKTGAWNLPEGTYTLLPPSPTARLGGRPSRWAKEHEKKTSPGRDVFGGKALPTRRVKRVTAEARP